MDLLIGGADCLLLVQLLGPGSLTSLECTALASEALQRPVQTALRNVSVGPIVLPVRAAPLIFSHRSPTRLPGLNRGHGPLGVVHRIGFIGCGSGCGGCELRILTALGLPGFG